VILATPPLRRRDAFGTADFEVIRRLALRTLATAAWVWHYVWLRMALRFGACTFHEAATYAASIQFGAGKRLRQRFYQHYLASCGADLDMHAYSIISMDNSRIGSRVLINSFVNLALVDIGDDCLISPGVWVIAGRRQHGFAARTVPMNQQPGEKRVVTIGRDVWLGAGSVIANDVGEGAIVSAGAVVIDEVPPYHIVAGVPARVIGMRPQ